MIFLKILFSIFAELLVIGMLLFIGDKVADSNLPEWIQFILFAASFSCALTCLTVFVIWAVSAL